MAHLSKVKWAKMPTEVIFDRTLTNRDKDVYAVLDLWASKSAKWFGGMKEIAAELRCSTRTVLRATMALRRAGYVAVERQGMKRSTIQRHRGLTQMEQFLFQMMTAERRF